MTHLLLLQLTFGLIRSSEDEVIPPQVNVNYNRVIEELESFERCKQKKYRPKFDKDKSKILSAVAWDDDKEEYKSHKIVVGPVKKRAVKISLQRKILLTMLTRMVVLMSLHSSLTTKTISPPYTC